MRFSLSVCFALALSLAAPAAQAALSAAETALAAADALRGATERLDRAQSAADQVAALTATIRAYEEGLSALRDGLRGAALREAEITASFDDKSDRLSRVLGAMMAMEQSPAPLLLLHPDGPESAVRSAMLLSDVAPALQAEAQALRGDLEEVAQLRALQEHAAAALLTGLTSVQNARTLLSQAVQDRTDLPQRFLEDPEELRALVESADTLDGFATGLAGMETDVGAPMGDFAGAKGRLRSPVMGTVLRRAGEADAAGIIRPGIVIATEPEALVIAPWPATIRYRGPLLDYENVMIVEPEQGYLLVLAGLDLVYGETGDVVVAGAALGQMGGKPTDGVAYAAGFIAGAKEGGGAGRTETLYMELRFGTDPLDPLAWFTGLGAQ